MKIGVSSCIMGNLCRYDGKGSKDSFVMDELSQHFELVGYCPEAPIFGTPRDTIRLVEVDKEIRVHIGKSGEDVTKVLEESSQHFAQEAKKDRLCGFVLKSKSPTCGMERVKVYQANNPYNEKKGVGFFAKALREVYPYLPIEEEGRLNDPWLKENFLMQVFAYQDFYEFLDKDPSFKELVAFHTSYKYLIYAKSQESYKILGNIVANREKQKTSLVLKAYEEAFLQTINQKSTINKTYNILTHILGYFKKRISKEEKEHILMACDEYKEGIIPLIAVIKLLNLYVKKFDDTYLKNQKFLNPYPKIFALRSDVKANK